MSTGQKGSKALTVTALKDRQMKKHTALKQKLKNDTKITPFNLLSVTFDSEHAGPKNQKKTHDPRNRHCTNGR